MEKLLIPGAIVAVLVIIAVAGWFKALTGKKGGQPQ